MSWVARSGSLAIRLAARVGASPSAIDLMNAVCRRVSEAGARGGLSLGACFGVFMFLCVLPRASGNLVAGTCQAPPVDCAGLGRFCVGLSPCTDDLLDRFGR